MPPGTVIQLLVGIITLAILFFTWWNKKNEVKDKAIEDEDKKIDSASNADDIMRDSGELR